VSTLLEGVPLAAMDGADPGLMDELLGAVASVARAGAFIGGEVLERFEHQFAAYCEAPYAVGVSSGTDALALALRALGVRAGDEVVVPANSFIATAEAVVMAEARPRFADVDLETQLVTAETIEAALTPRTRCVIPVHLYGRTVDLYPVMELAAAHEVVVLEDACQAHGARYRGRRVGAIADAGAFSFYPAKNLGAWGDAGALVTRREDVAEAVRLMRSHGERPRYTHRVIGGTARLDAIQAAVLSVKLAHLERANEGRRAIAANLRAALADSEAVLAPPAAPRWGDHVYHQFVVRTLGRERFRAELERAGIQTAIHYPVPINRTEAFRHLEEGEAAPRAAKLAGEIVSLPVFPAMGTGQLALLCDVLSGFG
jgi:dTDP-3-amino-3,4,6-trideoxy-alpha-D-glucose transaminase